MRILMLEPSARDQHAGFDQRLDHRFVGVALLALVGEDALAGKTRRLLGEAAVGVDGVGNGGVDAARRKFLRIRRPHVEILAPVAGRRVHETRAGVLGDVIPGKQRHGKRVVAANTLERMFADKRCQIVGADCSYPLERSDARLPKHIHRKLVGQDQKVPWLRPVFSRRIDNFIKAIFDLWRVTDRAIARDRPRRCRPNNDRGTGRLPIFHRRFSRGASDRKLYPHRIGRVVLILDFRFSKRGLFHHRPHHRLRAAIERAVGRKLHQLAGDLRLGVKIHRSVGMRPIADDAETLEFLALHADPMRGEGAALLAKFDQRRRIGQIRLRPALGPVVLLLDLPFDRQTVTVPAWHVIRIEAEHLLASRRHVLEDFVERMPDMDVAVGVGRAVVQYESRPAFAGGAQSPVQVDAAPAL